MTTNPALTGITFPAVTVTVTKVYIRGSTIITAIDLTDLGSNLGGDLRFDGCSSLSSITIPSTSNLVNFFIANNCALSGTFSLANLTNLSNYIDLAANSGLTGITFPSVTNIISSILLNNCGLTSLDISNLQNSGGTLFANTNPALTSLTLPSASSQNMTSFRVQSCNLSSLDLSGYNAVSGVVFAFGNSNLSSISFPSSTAAISFMWLYSCAFTSLDFSSLNLGGNINISSNTGLTIVTIPSTTNPCSVFIASNCALGVVDIDNMGSSDNISINLSNNGMTAAEVNENLVKIDNTGWINGVMSIQINTAPDTTSGGFNGVAAADSLIVKGWTVTTD